MKRRNIDELIKLLDNRIEESEETDHNEVPDIRDAIFMLMVIISLIGFSLIPLFIPISFGFPESLVFTFTSILCFVLAMIVAIDGKYLPNDSFFIASIYFVLFVTYFAAEDKCPLLAFIIAIIIAIIDTIIIYATYKGLKKQLPNNSHDLN